MYGVGLMTEVVDGLTTGPVTTSQLMMPTVKAKVLSDSLLVDADILFSLEL
jgi:hypothetical protein